MRKSYTPILVFVLLAGAALLLLGCSLTGSPATPTVLVPTVTSNGDIVSDAVVEPAHWVEVAYAVPGTALEVLVNEGDLVEKDQVLARLDTTHVSAAVAQAEAGLRGAQAQLAALKAGARPQEIAIAQAGVDAAQAQLDRLEQGARPEDIAPAQAALVVAQASLQKLLDGASEEEIAAATANYSNTVAALQQAQAAYDRVKADPGISARPESLRLQQATNAYDAALAQLNEVKRGARASDLAIARGQVQQAQAQVNVLKAPARAADIAAAKAELARAQAQLDLIKAGALPETVAAAEANVATAQAALDQAEASLADLELKAPMAGTVTDIRLKVGDQVAPLQPVFVLATLQEFYMRTTDLTELDIARVTVGQKAFVTLDALPGREFKGAVREVALQSKNNQGDVVYDVTIALDDPSAASSLRWGMSAEVRIPVQ
ncbi:MAG: HlyD family secretion protein [Anaerolineae bacterium]